jgi:hypothetical protein
VNFRLLAYPGEQNRRKNISPEQEEEHLPDDLAKSL